MIRTRRETVRCPKVGQTPLVEPRRLIWVPIIHTETDLGSLAGSVRHWYVAKLGASTWEERTRMVADMWQRIREQLQKLGLDLRRVRIYQDGLPCCGHELGIVRDLACAGSANHQLVRDLVACGATLTGTESPELLLEEYQLAHQVLLAEKTAGKAAANKRLRKVAESILQRRDRYIAQRINETLAPDETGLLFLGLLHAPAGYLARDIQVTRLSMGESEQAPGLHRRTS